MLSVRLHDIRTNYQSAQKQRTSEDLKESSSILFPVINGKVESTSIDATSALYLPELLKLYVQGFLLHVCEMKLAASTTWPLK